jgi:hypothetical protein
MTAPRAETPRPYVDHAVTVRAAAPRAPSWRGRLRWFTAEFLVVVAGVLVALAANDWAQRAREQRLAQEYTVRVIEDLDRIGESLQGVVHWTVALENAGNVLLPILEGRHAVEDSLRVLTAAYQASRLRAPDLSPIAYRELLATGQIRLFRDAAVRQALGHYFADFERADGFIEDIPRDYSIAARGALPPAFQIAMHDRCDNTSPLEECTPASAPEDMRASLERLRADVRATPALRRLLLQQHAVRRYAERQYELNRALRTVLAASLRGRATSAGTAP